MIRHAGRHRAMDLLALLETQFFPLQTGITNLSTKQHYRRAVRWLGAALGRPANISDLTNDHLVAVLTYCTTTLGQAPTTANGTHKCLTCLWRWCLNEGLVKTGPRVKPLKTPIRTPRAWSVAELDRLCAAADIAPGSIGGMPARVWWLTLFCLVMDGGIRCSELLALRWEWIDWDTASILVPAEVRKGQHHDEWYGLRPMTMDWLGKIRKPEGQILGWAGRHPSLYHIRWNELLERAGLPRGRYNQTQKLRRTFATLVHVSGGDATAAMGHGSRATTLKSYLDPSVCRTRHADLIPFHPLRGIAQ